MNMWDIVWLPFMAGMFYFLLFAPADVRRGIFRRQSPKDRFWLEALAIAVAVGLFVVSFFGWSYVKGATVLACCAICVRGGYLIRRRARYDCPADVETASENGYSGAEAAEQTSGAFGEIAMAGTCCGEPDRSGPPPEPRLSILHLLGLAVCVALYFGVNRTLSEWFLHGSTRVAASSAATHIQVLTTLFGTMSGVGTATALGGLVVLAARRWRGLRFPVYPGEYLWILLGAHSAVMLLSTLPLWLLRDLSPSWSRLVLVQWGAVGLLGALWLWAIVNVGTRRWRIFLGAVVVANILPGVIYVLDVLLFRTPGLSGSQGRIEFMQSLPYTVDLGLILVVYLDHRDGLHRPWTHWTGVLLRLWVAILWGVSLLLSRLQ